jgi:hypothetical protein
MAASSLPVRARTRTVARVASGITTWTQRSTRSEIFVLAGVR